MKENIDSIQQDTFSMLATLPDRPERTALQPPILLPFADGMHEGNGSATPPSLDGAPAFHDDPTLHADISTPLAPSGAEKQECLKEAVQRLAGLPKLDYEVIRKTEAIRLDVRPSFLDQAVEAARSDEDQEPPEEMFPDVEPWDEPVDANQLLDEVHATIRSFIVCDKAASITATLWIAFTWFIDFVQVAPIAVITAPQKRCGKSQLLDVMAKISCRPLVASSVTPAALFRVIEGHKPTLFIDEADTFLKENEMLRGIINSGHTRQSAFVLRTTGEDFEPKRFSTWGAKVLCGIGKLPSTIMDRAVVLELRRKLKNERVLRLRYSDPAHFRILARKLARLAEDRGDEIAHARPELPEALNDRAQDNWEPLLAIADLAGGTWPQTARSIAVFSAGEDEDIETSTLLLLDIQDAFNGMQTSETILGKDVKRMTTQILLGKLCADDTRPWATFDRSGGKMMYGVTGN